MTSLLVVEHSVNWHVGELTCCRIVYMLTEVDSPGNSTRTVACCHVRYECWQRLAVIVILHVGSVLAMCIVSITEQGTYIQIYNMLMYICDFTDCRVSQSLSQSCD